jgi:hypothetical protein
MVYFSSVVWVVCENHGYTQVKELQSHQLLASRGAVLHNYFSVTHPSGPNYRSMAAGDYFSHDEHLGQEKPTIATHTGVPALVWSYKGAPALRHNPLADLKSAHQKVTDLDLESLPASCILYVGLDDQNNAHSGPLDTADQNLVELIGRLDASAWFNRPVDGRYPVLFVTWDEAYTTSNQVFAAFYGQGVQPGASLDTRLDHFSFCRLVTDNWEKAPLGKAATANVIADIWK